jgi:hypothetical protein
MPSSGNNQQAHASKRDGSSRRRFGPSQKNEADPPTKRHASSNQPVRTDNVQTIGIVA